MTARIAELTGTGTRVLKGTSTYFCTVAKALGRQGGEQKVRDEIKAVAARQRRRAAVGTSRAWRGVAGARFSARVPGSKPGVTRQRST